MLIVEKSTYRKPGRAVARRLTQWLVAVVMIASAAMADAQVIGLYYQETEKDGRIYVFNTPERFKMW